MQDKRELEKRNVSSQQHVPTVGELERSLSQSVSKVYRQLTGQQPARIVCHFFANSVALLLEKSVTPVEELLLNAAQLELANQIRISINVVIREQVKVIAEAELQVDVRAVLIDSVLGTGLTGIFIMLTHEPAVRNPEFIPKTEASRRFKKQQASLYSNELEPPDA